jgi:hypothetical protein
MKLPEQLDEDGVPTPLLFLEICTKCHKYVVFMDDVCINCFVPDFIDLELVYEDK